MQLFDIASRHREWLALRQATVAENISNANTPNYTARSVRDFSEALMAADVRLAVTNRAHMTDATASPNAATVEQPEPEASTHSGNNVDVDRELLAAGEVRGGYALNVSMVKSFNRMLQSATRS